jgi:hypothetical protein
LANEILLPGAAADHDPLNRRAVLRLCLDDLPEPVADAAQAGDIKGVEARDVGVHAETGDDSACMRIGEGRAVDEELGKDMHRPSKAGGLGQD